MTPSDGRGALAAQPQLPVATVPAPVAARSEPLAVPAEDDRVTLRGALERITYRNDENGYTVGRFATDEGARVTVVGTLLGAAPGNPIKLFGSWTTHVKYGRQFKVDTYADDVPATSEGIARYLASGQFKGIGPATAERIVGRFGTDTLRVLDEEPERLAHVPGVGRHKAKLLAEAWAVHHAARDLMLYLQGHGVTPGLAGRIYAVYGDEALGIVQHNPYRLPRDVYGVGFRTADRLALDIGLPRNSPDRLDAGILFALEEAAEDGHTFPPRAYLVERAATLLGTEPDDAERAVTRMVQRGDVVEEDTHVGLPVLVHAETGIALRLAAAMSDPDTRLAAFTTAPWADLFATLDAASPHPLTPEQRQAVETALTSKVAILTGGPGTGKTTTVRALLMLARAGEGKVALAAPTGRAAKRLAEATGHAAQTVHRLLEWSPQSGGGFKRGPDTPLAADLVVVDEASMLDTQLAHALVRAVNPAAHLLFVGDSDQLPSVGPGNVLGDLLDSGVVPAVRLTQIHRQAAASHIVSNAHRIHQGEMPVYAQEADFFLFRTDEAERAAQLVVEVMTQRIPRRFGMDPRRDVQVLSPMHRGPAGVGALNLALQAVLNPPRPGRAELVQRDRTLRVGDKVMQTKNDYGRDVFNGDQGHIARIDQDDGTLIVDFEGRDVSYSFADTDALTLAYACSVHKSQGSEFPAIVLALLPAHYVMLQRNLLYTAVTRARQLCVIVGSERAIGMAVRNDQVAERHTSLARRLTAAMDGGH